MTINENQIAVIEKKPYDEEGIYKLAKSNFTDDTTCVFWYTYWRYFNKNKQQTPISWDVYCDNKDYMHATESQMQQLKQSLQQQRSRLPKTRSEKREEQLVVIKDEGDRSNTLAENGYTGPTKLKIWNSYRQLYHNAETKPPVASWKEYCESTKYLKATESQIQQYKESKQQQQLQIQKQLQEQGQKKLPKTSTVKKRNQQPRQLAKSAISPISEKRNVRRKEQFVVVKDIGSKSNTLAESDYTGPYKLKTWHAYWTVFNRAGIEQPVASWKDYCISTKYLKATESQIQQYKESKQKENQLREQQKQSQQQQTMQQLQQQPQPQKPLHQLQHQQLELQQQLHQLQQQQQPIPQTLQQDRLIQQQTIDSLIRQQTQQTSDPNNQKKRKLDQVEKTDEDSVEQHVEEGTPKRSRYDNPTTEHQIMQPRAEQQQVRTLTEEYEKTFEWPEYELTEGPDYCLQQNLFSGIDDDPSGLYQWEPVSDQSNDDDNEMTNPILSSSARNINTSQTLFYSPQKSEQSTEQSSTQTEIIKP